MKITWVKAARHDYWIGSVGQASTDEREAYIIHKVKPPSARKAPHLRLTWKYEYTLVGRYNMPDSFTHRIGDRYPSLDAAKQAAFAHASGPRYAPLEAKRNDDHSAADEG